MIKISDPQKIHDNLYCLGPNPLPSFLLKGSHSAIFDSGMSIAADMYIKEIKKILGNEKPAYLFITHMHFDHCGASALLKKEFPEMLICSSAEGAEIIQRPNAIELIKKLNKMPGMEKMPGFEPFSVDRIIEDNEEIAISENLTVRAIKTPGHTRDMFSYYIPELKTLIPSETVGVPSADGYIFSEFLIDYDKYIESLYRLKNLEINTICMAHGTIYTDEDASGFIENAIASTIKFKGWVEELFDQHNGDQEKILQIVKKEEFDPLPQPKQMDQAYLLNLKAKIMTVARRLEKNNKKK